MFACNGILFNHESPLRGETFVSRKITRGVARIVMGLQQKLYMGNLDAKRDWGYAKDYVECMWLMLQQDSPRDYVVASGETYSVRQFAQWAFEEAGISIRWEGSGVDERGVDARTGQVRIAVDAKYFRPAEVELLWGDPTLARNELGWTPRTSIRDLIRLMVEHDLRLAKKEAATP